MLSEPLSSDQLGNADPNDDYIGFQITELYRVDSFLALTIRYNMPVLEIALFPGSESYLADPTILDPALDFLTRVEGWIRYEFIACGSIYSPDSNFIQVHTPDSFWKTRKLSCWLSVSCGQGLEIYMLMLKILSMGNLRTP